MSRLFDAYRACHEQAFVPIFTQDPFDSRREVEACATAGCKAIEFTLRSPDAREMIPWIRREYPHMFLLVGSTLDDERMVRHLRRRHPQLMTIAELADLGVDGFVSMVGWTEASIRRYSPDYLIVPTAMTVTEALQQTSWGAQFQKLSGADLGFVRRCRQAATFDFCPVVVTGGQTPAAMPETFKAGAVWAATGFDLSLKGKPADVGVDEIAAVVTEYVAAAKAARHAAWPELARTDGGPADAWLSSLPHWHPF